jgi:hypothetical protein
MEMETDKEKEQKEDRGKGKEDELPEERKKWYEKDLILPPGGLPRDLMSGVIRVVDGKEYKLDDYINQACERNLTPLETNIYHAGNTDPYILPMPFRNLDYSTPFGRTILEALGKDPIATAIVEWLERACFVV